jgi:hypothetical protein
MPAVPVTTYVGSRKPKAKPAAGPASRPAAKGKPQKGGKRK